MTPGPDLQQLINTIKDDAGSDDELVQLGEAASTISELTSTGDAALGFFVDRARGAGKSWVEISAVLGVSKQAAHKRFADAFGAKTFDRFTPRTANVVRAAVDVANGRNLHFVGAEDILLAFFTQPSALASQVLIGRGLTEQKLYKAVELASPSAGKAPAKPITPEDPAYTRSATHVLQGAVASALTLGHNYVGTEHLLLAFYRDTGGKATKILIEQGLDEDTALQDIRTLLDQVAK
ncbi:ATP-dependent Clp protease ATP-binding subunit [Kribbella antibiotica]|uniref:ATP-dependent Clp protease ATP-binding subunit n=1 Tax=Kribbella antibiotica TaxID=190195 RepID=A0A4R4ZIZ3_9ACTN|nr:Clp protease N-terminal domain-containing protein [Kribbella antibiotica]TDD58698.1 ATP-dependent Clp protease ATP-binding subunit [Kribbella antibiotica]